MCKKDEEKEQDEEEEHKDEEEKEDDEDKVEEEDGGKLPSVASDHENSDSSFSSGNSIAVVAKKRKVITEEIQKMPKDVRNRELTDKSHVKVRKENVWKYFNKFNSISH